MRIQLIRPLNHFVSPQVFNRMFTMHGTTMIFFVAMPVMFGFANYLVPLMIGARDMAFPRLNAFSFWMTAFGGLLLYFSFFGGDGLYGAGSAPDVGWFAYAPLTSQTFSPGHSTDFWTLSLLVSGFGSIGTAINIIATILCMRCKGMILGKMPLFAWLNLTMARLVILAVRPAHGRAIDAAGGPLPGRALLRHAGRRLRSDVDALLLGLRTSGSVCARDSRFCIRFGNHSRFLPQSDFRLPHHGGRNGVHRIYQHERLGPPHVHGRHDFQRKHVLCAFHYGHCRSHGNQDFQLAGHHVGRTDSFQDSDAVLHRISVSVPDRRPDRSDAGRGAVRLATDRILLRGRALSLRDRGRHSLHALRSFLLLVPEDVRKNVQREARQIALLALHSSDFI